MLNDAQRERLEVILVSPRNPLNIGAVARAMANFGFARLTVAAPFAPHWREARSAVGAPDVLRNARETASVAEAVSECTFVAGTGTVAHRKPEQDIVALPDLGPLMRREMERGGRAAILFGPEKHGLTREDLSYCHALVEIPTDARQPSMNLGQAAAVCLYELTRRGASRCVEFPRERNGEGGMTQGQDALATSEALDRLAGVMEEAMTAADYSPGTMRAANAHDLRLMLRRLRFSAHDTRRAMGLFRRVVWSLKRKGAPGNEN